MATSSTTEAAYQDKVIAWCEKLPFCKATKIPASIYGNNGVSDVLICLRGFYIAVELKKPGRNCEPFKPESPTEHLQERYIIEVDGAGGDGIFSSDFEKFKKYIFMFDRRLQTICAPFDTLAELLLSSKFDKMDSLVNPV